MAIEKRNDYPIYNINKLSALMPYSDAYKKLSLFCKGSNSFVKKEEVKDTIKVLNEEHKKTVDSLKSLIK